MRYLLLVPMLLMPLAAIGMHVTACGLHAAAVDGMSNPATRERYRGIFYRYCKIMSAPLRAMGPQYTGENEAKMTTKAEQSLAETILKMQEPDRLREENMRLRGALRDLLDAYLADVNPNDRNQAAIEHARQACQ